MSRWLNDPRFGVMTTRLILWVAIGSALVPIPPTLEAPNPQITTFLSGIPDANLHLPAVAYGLQAAVIISSVLWLLGWAVPLSCWAAVLSFAGLAAVRIESATEVCHSSILLWWLMVIHAAWSTFDAGEWSAERPDPAAGRRYPAWVFGLSIFVLAWFHTLSGIGKWLAAAGPDWTAGWSWADGVSLQLWLQAFGNPTSRLTQWLIQDQTAALIAQRAILLIELTAVVAMINPTLRRVIGGLLVIYYLFFLHCFVDWFGIFAAWGLGSSTVEVSTGASFPVLSYVFSLFGVAWFFLVSDHMLGRWEKEN